MNRFISPVACRSAPEQKGVWMKQDYSKYMFNENDFLPQDYHVENDERRELLFKLAAMITDDISVLGKGAKAIDETDPDFWLLDRLLTTTEIRVMLSFGKKRVVKRKINEIADVMHMDIGACQKVVDHIAQIGLLEFDRENPERERQYFVPKWVVGSGDYMMMNGAMLEEHPEVATFFNYASSVPVGKVAHMVPPGGGGLGMHVIPVEKAIEMNQESVSIERISHWLDKYDKYCLDVCTCRRQQRIRGEGGGDIEDYYCIALGDMAEYLVETHKDARYATKEEVLDVLYKAEKRGYVHQITNLDGEDKIVGICNCSNTTCNALRTSQLFNTPNMSASAYRAHVDHEKCAACGKCVEVCPVGAAKLGQKLCRKDGSEVTYPKSELPNVTKWGPDKWNVNYREDAKINCYETGTSPCKSACPAHLPVQAYVRMAAEGRFTEALKLIKQDNPFPAVCGAICNRRCEDACTRGTIDDPVAIDEIKKYIASLELGAQDRFIPICEKDDGGMWGPDYKMAVIGAGPAGLSAAYYLRTRGYDVTVFDRESRPGGMMLNGIPTFRLEKEVIEAEIDVLRQMGVEFKCGVDVGKDVTIKELRQQGYKAFYLAIGLQGGRSAGVPGEDAQGVESGISFLSRINQDHTLRFGGDVVVIGGGNVAVDVARSARRASDGKVTMLCLEGPEGMPAARDEVAEAKEEGIEILNGWGPKQILVSGGKVTGVDVKK